MSPLKVLFVVACAVAVAMCEEDKERTKKEVMVGDHYPYGYSDNYVTYPYASGYAHPYASNYAAYPYNYKYNHAYPQMYSANAYSYNYNYPQYNMARSYIQPTVRNYAQSAYKSYMPYTHQPSSYYNYARNYAAYPYSYGSDYAYNSYPYAYGANHYGFAY